MDLTKNYKVAMLLYTAGLDYDDRIRKEILSIQELYSNISFKIFAVDAKNREEEGVTSYGVPYRVPYLTTRDKYKSGTHTLAKAWNFYQSVKDEIKNYDAVWCADVETFLFVLLTRNKPLVWDLHELPTRFMHKKPMKWLFRHLESRCKAMVHANEQRLQYLIETGYVRHKERNFVLRNYPQFNETDNEYDETYKLFSEWLGEDKCVYLQGINAADRADVESINAVLAVNGLKGVVVGYTRPELLELLQKEHTLEELKGRLFFTGRVKQLKTPQYIQKCLMGMVFYKNTGMNNWYCEANRFFQNIINGSPVVVGQNPSLREAVNTYKIGVVAETDGCDSREIYVAINKLLDNYKEYKANVDACKNTWLWNQQNETLRLIVNKIFQI